MKPVIIILFILLSATNIIAQETFESYADKGNAAIEENNLQEALLQFSKAIEIGSDDTTKMRWCATLAGVCAYELKDNANAQKFYTIAFDHNSQDADVIDRLIELAKEAKDNEQLEKVYLECKQRFPDQQSRYDSKLLYFYYNSKSYEKAKSMADVILGYKPGNSKVLYMKAMALAMGGSNKEAKLVFEEVLSAEPENVKAITQLGLLYYREATSIYDTSVNNYNKLKNPDRVDYSNYRKEKVKSWDSYNLAVKYLDQAYKISPSKQVKQALFNAYERLEKKEMSEKYK